MLVSMNQQRAAAKTVGSRVRQTCGQTGRRGQLADMESQAKPRAVSVLHALSLNEDTVCLSALLGQLNEINMQGAFCSVR